ncbi:MAG: uroporphyrinogen-III synthase, partial [Acidobacteriota bacterium]|nr:uroporphyrinogen-III synthase [Acidobacteriota bacterium]
MASATLTSASFEGLPVAAFESRRAAEIATLISRHGGVPFVAPSMREIPIRQNPEAMAFGEKLLAGQLDVVIFMTGVGVTSLIEVLESRYDRAEISRALLGLKVVARGSKTVRALSELGVSSLLKVPEPNTWREVLQTLSDPALGIVVKGARIALQEYGAPDDRLVSEIEALGAEVLRVPVYRWAFPEDLAPLEKVSGEIIAGRIRIVLFSSAVQADHLMKYAAERSIDAALRAALNRCVICSVGPTCTESLKAHGLSVDLEPEPHKLGILVHESARNAAGLLRKKGGALSVGFPDKKAAAPRWDNSRFMRACRLEEVDSTPVWLMRQAGRYMKEYRDLRARVPFLELCKNPDLVAEVTVSAAERIGSDAAILFADLLLIAEPMGFSLEYDRGGGPHVSPALDPAQIGRLRHADVLESLNYVIEAVRRTRANLDEAIPLIGFAGAPFTLASYLIEGGASRVFRRTKTLMFSDPGAWRALMEYLARHLAVYINGQIDA